MTDEMAPAEELLEPFWLLRRNASPKMTCLLDSLEVIEKQELSWITRIVATAPISVGAFFIVANTIANTDSSVSPTGFTGSSNYIFFFALLWFLFFTGTALIRLFDGMNAFGVVNRQKSKAIHLSRSDWEKKIDEALRKKCTMIESAKKHARTALLGLLALTAATTYSHVVDLLTAT